MLDEKTLPPTSAANVRARRKEADMKKQKYTVLYSRLSRDDGEDSVSNSIKNQRAMLEEYAERNGLVPFRHVQDDGYSGTNFDRPGWTELMNMVDADEVSAILFKTMDRMGRDYLRVGMYRQEFREKGIRIIATSEGYDSEKGEDDFMPFREIMAEWFARDTSRKIKSVVHAKGNSGKPLASQPPYGYADVIIGINPESLANTGVSPI